MAPTRLSCREGFAFSVTEGLGGTPPFLQIPVFVLSPPLLRVRLGGPSRSGPGTWTLSSSLPLGAPAVAEWPRKGLTLPLVD